MAESLRFEPCGDRALIVYLGTQIDPQVNQRVHELARLVARACHPAIVEITPSYHCLMVEYDPVRIRLTQVAELVMASLTQLPDQQPESSRVVQIPVCYDNDYGPDLQEVARLTGMSATEVAALHSATPYRVYALGFSPGFCYLGGLDKRLHVPRLSEPRTHMPGGSVGIGGEQTGVYPSPSPGGWHLIGRTPLKLFDFTADPPVLVEPGDCVQFKQISAAEYAKTPNHLSRPLAALVPGEGAAGLRILSPGIATSIQDLGRRGYMRYGVPVGGASDFRALMIGNWLLGNRSRTSALEITMGGPEVEFTGPMAFCLTGAPMAAELIPADGSSPQRVPGWCTMVAGPGDRLRIGTASAGLRSYLCVAGGFDLPPVLGSLSEDLFGHVGPLGRPIKAGDWLPIGLPLHPPADLAGRSLPPELLPACEVPATIRIVCGPHTRSFHPEAWTTLLNSEYLVQPQSDRQGLRLIGPTINHTGHADILSEPTPPGAIQVPSNGQPILLLGNRQTTGGYTIIGVAVYPDLALAAQVRPGDPIRFQEVALSDAHAIAWAERRRLGQVRRLLQREIRSQFGQKLPKRLIEQKAPLDRSSTVPSATAVTPTALTTRLFRITISDIEFEAAVEEVEEVD